MLSTILYLLATLALGTAGYLALARAAVRTVRFAKAATARWARPKVAHKITVIL